MTIVTDEDCRTLPLQKWLDETEQMLIPNQYLICENLIKKYSKELEQLKMDIKALGEKNGVYFDDEMPIEIDGDYEDPTSFTIKLRVHHNCGWKEYDKIQDGVWDLMWKLPNEINRKMSIHDW